MKIRVMKKFSLHKNDAFGGCNDNFFETTLKALNLKDFTSCPCRNFTYIFYIFFKFPIAQFRVPSFTIILEVNFIERSVPF